MTILVNKGNRLIINHIMSKINGVFLVWLLIVLCRSDPEGCQKFVDQLVNSIVTVNFSSIPPPSVMYSGITTNNPGQKLECEEAGFHYFLVSIHNSTVNSDVFTGICVSPECSREDIEVDLEFLDCKVYEFFP